MSYGHLVAIVVAKSSRPRDSPCFAGFSVTVEFDLPRSRGAQNRSLHALLAIRDFDHELEQSHFATSLACELGRTCGRCDQRDCSLFSNQRSPLIDNKG